MTWADSSSRRTPECRLADNDIVLDDASVSRHHAVVIDTGTNWVITDLRSANGVKLRQQRIRGTATLTGGDQIGIGGHEFTFEIPPPETELPDSAPDVAPFHCGDPAQGLA